MKAIRELRQELSQGWRSFAEGWGQLRDKAASALTRFDRTAPPHRFDRGLRHFPEAGPAWGLLLGEVFEDADRIIVRLEAPGMESRDFQVRVMGERLLISGDKRFSRQSEAGRYRLLECAYRQFERWFDLPAPVLADKVQATYRQGVLRVELPKARRIEPRRIEVHVR